MPLTNALPVDLCAHADAGDIGTVVLVEAATGIAACRLDLGLRHWSLSAV